MTGVPAKSSQAGEALALVESLQKRFAEGLEEIAARRGAGEAFEHVEWLRDQGRHGGGHRFAVAATSIFGRAAINVSSVHYDDDPSRKLGSATAISTIIHPRHPRAPSYHMHISWTEMRSGDGYWRLMADLNPAIEDEEATAVFKSALEDAAGEHFLPGLEQGDKYFFIPSLGRHRGVAHFYLEGYSSGDFAADSMFAQRFGETILACYLGILDRALAGAGAGAVRDGDARAQLEYHTLYLLQVLTLDRGTTSGLLVHNQNDLGILGSIPAAVDRDLLSSWRERQTPPLDRLVEELVSALRDEGPSKVDDEVRRRLAETVRRFFSENPAALELQARGDRIPPTVANHLMPSP